MGVPGPTRDFIIEQRPKPKKAPGIAGFTVYNPSRNAMAKWIAEARSHIPEDWIKFTGAVDLDIMAFFRRPLKHFKRGIRKASHLKKDAPVHYILTPDADNLAKFANDCLSGLGFRDDRQVTDLRIRKRWTFGLSHWRIRLAKHLQHHNS